MHRPRKQIVEVLNFKVGTLDYHFRILKDPVEHQFHKYFIDDKEVAEEEFKEKSSHLILVTTN